jgi:alkanesulfonate monooxygenase SsuD/methylene tetrahydromethanopterin reductase-like flavin-dependent oxidoreductase (luciferase family)
MELGLALPQYDWDGPLEWARVVETAQQAEELGFDSVWLSDHLFLDPARYGKPSARAFCLDPIVGLGAIARATTRIRLGTLVVCAQLRPPAVLAKMLATLNDLSGGRVIAGTGAGWFEPEFAEAGIPFERPSVRVRQLEDTVTTMKERWAGAGPPVWVAGKGDKVMEVAVRHAEGFNHGGWTDDAGPKRFAEFRATCERLGRDPATITLSALQGVEDPNELPGQLARYEAEGVAVTVVTVGPLPFAVTTFDALKRVASARP